MTAYIQINPDGLLTVDGAQDDSEVICPVGIEILCLAQRVWDRAMEEGAALCKPPGDIRDAFRQKCTERQIGAEYARRDMSAFLLRQRSSYILAQPARDKRADGIEKTIALLRMLGENSAAKILVDVVKRIRSGT